jgi:hypothetical protein
MLQTMYYRIDLGGQIDGQRRGMHAELCGEVYGYEFGCLEAFGNIKKVAVAISLRVAKWIWGLLERQRIRIDIHMVGRAPSCIAWGLRCTGCARPFSKL